MKEFFECVKLETVWFVEELRTGTGGKVTKVRVRRGTLVGKNQDYTYLQKENVFIRSTKFKVQAWYQPAPKELLKKTFFTEHIFKNRQEAWKFAEATRRFFELI